MTNYMNYLQMIGLLTLVLKVHKKKLSGGQERKATFMLILMTQYHEIGYVWVI